MAKGKWLGPGVLKGIKGAIKPGEEIDSNNYKPERWNQLVDKKLIEGKKVSSKSVSTPSVGGGE